MKSIYKKIAIASVIITVITAIIFAACKKTNEIEITSKKENTVQVKPSFSNYSIGELHNICCEQIMRNGNGDSIYYTPSTKSINKWLDICKSTMVKLDPKNTAAIEMEINSIKKYLSDYGDDRNGINKFVSNKIYTSDIINEVVGEKYFPQDLGILLLSLKKCVLSSRFDASLYNDILYQIEKTSSSPQKEYFMDVHKHSSAFWKSISKPTKDPIYPPEGWTCNEWTIMMDGIGALYGLVFGPIASIILGTVFSIMTAHDCEERPK